MLLTGVRNWLNRQAADASVLDAEPMPESVEPLALPANPHSAAAARVAVTAKLWGEGFILPGGEFEAIRFATPLGLSAASSLLLLGCGPGGAPRAIANHLGVWVTGFESDADFAAAGAALCAHAGLGRRAQVQTWDPAAPRFGHRSFHHALAFEPVRTSTPETVLGALALALRPGGQIALLQTVADSPLNLADPVIGHWSRLEHRSPELPPEVTISRVLGRLGFEIRVAEDVSQRHVKLAIRGWRDAVRAMQDKPSALEAAVLVREAELWLLRIRLIRSGQLRLVRWHAIHRVAQ